MRGYVMIKKLGILFTSRNNYELLQNWMDNVDTGGLVTNAVAPEHGTVEFVDMDNWIYVPYTDLIFELFNYLTQYSVTL